MGNCQAVEAATVVIHHPAGNKVEKIYCSVSASQIMNSNPGHYVAMLVAAKAENGAPVKQMKLLRPDDTLVLGQVYQLISFEDVLKELSAKKCVKLGKLLKERRGASNMEPKKSRAGFSFSFSSRSGSKSSSESENDSSIKDMFSLGNGASSSGSSSSRVMGRQYSGGGQWRPALHSISELGTA